MKEPSPSLRPTTPEEILSYIIPREETAIDVQIAHDGGKVTVPKHWKNGGGLEGDALVNFHDLLTTPFAGTQIPLHEYISWLRSEGARFSSEEGEVSAQQAVSLLSSDLVAMKVKKDNGYPEPILRIIRPGEPGRNPIMIEYYGGAENMFMQGISAIGNLKHPRGLNKLTYQGQIAALLNSFITKGTKPARKIMGVSESDITKIDRKVDDVGAAHTTFCGYKLVNKLLHGQQNHVFEIIDVAIGTIHQAVYAMHQADEENNPLLLRVGAPAMGLLGEEIGLNYIGNTTTKMLEFGPYTCGDVGTLLDQGDNKDQVPHVVPKATADSRHQIVLFLGGGWPIYRLALEGYKDIGKPMPTVIFIRAKRVDNGSKEWGVLMSGVELTNTHTN